jgi:hypothetical protein
MPAKCRQFGVEWAVPVARRGWAEAEPVALDAAPRNTASRVRKDNVLPGWGLDATKAAALTSDAPLNQYGNLRFLMARVYLRLTQTVLVSV